MVVVLGEESRHQKRRKQRVPVEIPEIYDGIGHEERELEREMDRR